MLRMQALRPCFPVPVPLPQPDWTTLVGGSALWALALVLPLSLPLERLEAELAQTGLSNEQQQALLLVSSLLLALGVGLVIQLLLSWALSPSWAGSLGLIMGVASLFFGLAQRSGDG